MQEVLGVPGKEPMQLFILLAQGDVSDGAGIGIHTEREAKLVKPITDLGREK